jgi:hypothetical protein
MRTKKTLPRSKDTEGLTTNALIEVRRIDSGSYEGLRCQVPEGFRILPNSLDRPPSIQPERASR